MVIVDVISSPGLPSSSDITILFYLKTLYLARAHSKKCPIIFNDPKTIEILIAWKKKIIYKNYIINMLENNKIIDRMIKKNLYKKSPSA